MKIFLSVIVLFFMTSSCKDFLDLKPEGSLVQEEFWQNKGQVESAVAACYASMNQNNYISRVIQWGELRAEMLVSSSASSNQSNMMKGFTISTNSIVSWSNFYTTINYCNTVLAFADEAKALDATFTDDELNRLKAEATSIRALTYLILVKNFKEVPLVLTATLSDQTDFYVAKNTESEILNQIIADLEGSIEFLADGFSTSVYYDKGRVTKGGALAILADAYLWDEQYDNCADACQEIVKMNKYSLVSGVDWFNQLFFEGNSSEGIFELQFDTQFSALKTYYYVADHDFLAYSDIVDLYADNPNDVRALNATYAASRLVFKFAGINSVSGEYRASSEFYNNWIFYRYADVLLMQAEAYIFSEDKQNLPKAFELINAVSERATGTSMNVISDQSSLAAALLLERQKEFAFEGKRWHDLLRFARRNNYQDQQLIIDMAESKTTVDNYEEIMSYYADTASYFLPIYESEINLNSNLVQNPYYEED